MNKFLENPAYKKYRELILISLDMFCVVFSFLMAIFLKLDFDFSRYSAFGYRNFLRYFIVVIVVYLISFLLFRVHRSLWSYLGIKEVLNIALSILTSTFVLVVFLVFTSTDLFLVSITIIAGILCLLLMANIRVFYRFWRVHQRDGSELKNALIVGAGDGGYLMLKEIEHNKRFNSRVVGFVDDQRTKSVVAGKSVLGDTYDLPKIVEKYNISVVYIAIPSASKADIQRIVAICQSCGVSIKIMQRSDSSLLDDSIEERLPIKPVSINDLLGRGEVSLNTDEIKSYLTGKTVLVTGAGGSIGSELCRQIVKFSPKLIVLLDIYENTLYYLEQSFRRDIMHGYMSDRIEFVSIIASIQDRQTLDRIMEKYRPDVVYHAAAHKHVPLMETSPLEAIKNNVFGTRNVIDSCIAHGVSRFILISTDKAVNPTSVMGATKRMAELILQSRSGSGVTNLAAVRFGNVLGSNGSVIPLFEKQIAEGGPVTITHRDIVRYFMTIPEAAQLVLQAGYYADSGEIFVLDMGEPVKILDLAEKMIRLSGYTPYEDIDIVEVGLRPGEKMYEELKLSEEKVYMTKNRSIQVSQPVGVTRDDVEMRLACLHSLVQEGASPQEAKKTLLEMVKTRK